jgi:serine/threonine-protein kinase HipA
MSELIAYLAGRRAGHLISKDNGNLQFSYDSGYTGPALSQSLPLQEEAHPHSACRAVFGGLLLEGEARDALARNLGVSIGNDYALLEAVGGDCAGAIVLLAPGVDLPVEPLSRGLDDEQLDAALRELPQRPLAANREQGVRLSLAGTQPKLPVIIEGSEVALPLNVAAATTHIIKPEPSRFPGLVDNEAFCLELAQAVGLPAATASKQVSASGLPYLLVERYDRDLTSEPIRRLHQEDICQALGRPSDRKYQSEGGPAITDVVALLRTCSAVPAQDLSMLWRALVLNWLVGNCDAHAKNFSLLYDTGTPTLAPLYDVVCTTAYPELTRRLAMSIGGARKIDEVDQEAWTRLAKAVHYSPRFARSQTGVTIERVLEEAAKLASQPRHDNEAAGRILRGILMRGRPET